MSVIFPDITGGVGFTLGLVDYWDNSEIFTYIMVSTVVQRRRKRYSTVLYIFIQRFCKFFSLVSDKLS